MNELLCPLVASQARETSGTAVTPAELLVSAMNGDVNSVYTFKCTAKNDDCSAVTPGNRCDEDSLSLKKLTDAVDLNANSSFATSDNFFAKDRVIADLAAKLAAPATTPPDSTYVCTRCANPATILKEWWTNLPSATDTALETCEGDGSSCEVSRCLTTTGATLITADVNIGVNLKI